MEKAVEHGRELDTLRYLGKVYFGVYFMDCSSYDLIHSTVCLASWSHDAQGVEVTVALLGCGILLALRLDAVAFSSLTVGSPWLVLELLWLALTWRTVGVWGLCPSCTLCCGWHRWCGFASGRLLGATRGREKAKAWRRHQR